MGDCLGETLENYFKYLIEYEDFLKMKREYRMNKKASAANGRRKKRGTEGDCESELMIRPVQFARILDQIRREDCAPDRPWEVDEDLDSDSAGDREDL